MGKPHYDGTKVETTQGWYMVKNLSTLDKNGSSCSEAP